jgi:hypothetical protein
MEKSDPESQTRTGLNTTVGSETMRKNDSGAGVNEKGSV